MKSNNFLINKKPYLLPFTPSSLYKLDIVETLFPQCPAVIDAARAAVTQLYQYPTLEAVTVLEKATQQYTGFTKPIIFTNGSDNALKLIVDSLFTPESRIAIITPTYPHFVQMAETSPATLTYIRCETEQDILDHIPEISKMNLVYICSPNLPFGYICPDAIIKLCECNPNLIVVADEAYREFGPSTVVPQLDKFDNLIVTRTFSKFFGLAALRLGYLMTNSALFNTLQIMQNGKNITRIAAAAGTAALQNIEYYNRQLCEFDEARSYIEGFRSLLRADSPIYDMNLQYGNFFLLKARNTARVCQAFSDLAGIAVRDKSAEVTDAIRLSIAPQRIMQIVRNVIVYINGFSPICRYIVDLDATIRPNSKITSAVDPSVKQWLRTTPCDIATNNTVHSDEYIRWQLENPDIRIVRPQALADSYIVSRAALEINDAKHEYSNVAIMSHVLDVGTDVWARVAELKAAGAQIHVVELTATTSLDASSETAKCGKVIIPDVGTFLQSMGLLPAVIIGKPNLDVTGDVVIGDGESDRQLAKKINAEFIHVDTSLGDESRIDESGIHIPNLATWVKRAF